MLLIFSIKVAVFVDVYRFLNKFCQFFDENVIIFGLQKGIKIDVNFISIFLTDFMKNVHVAYVTWPNYEKHSKTIGFSLIFDDFDILVLLRISSKKQSKNMRDRSKKISKINQKSIKNQRNDQGNIECTGSSHF